jgi:hypothetical protein
MSNSESDDAINRKQKLEILRAKRINQETTSHDDTGKGDLDGNKGGLRDRLKRALTNRKQATGEAGEMNETTRGLQQMNSENNGQVPRKKGAMKKRIMKKLAMKKRAIKKRGTGQGNDEQKVNDSSTLEEITKHRGFLERRIDKLKSALDDKAAELAEVVKLEAEKSKAK